MDAYKLEKRAAREELRVSTSGKLVGYAAVFNHESKDLGNFTESIRPGAFSRSLQSPNDIMALYDHDGSSVLGRVGAGTLVLNEDERGLYFEIDLPPTSVGNDLGVLVERGDVHGASFAFTVPDGGESWRDLNGKPHRELLDVKLHEITITSNPAYADTEVSKRVFPWSLVKPTDSPRVRLAYVQRYLETV